MNTNQQLTKLQSRITRLQNNINWSQWLIQTYQAFIDSHPDTPTNRQARLWAQQSLALEEKRLKAFQTKTIQINQEIAKLLS